MRVVIYALERPGGGQARANLSLYISSSISTRGIDRCDVVVVYIVRA